MTLAIQNLSKSFGRKVVLDNVTAAFPTGLTLLTGPSGTGKSTLLRILATADRPSKGTVFWQDTPLPAGRKALRTVLGYSPQAVDLPEDLTGREFGMHLATLKGLECKAAEAQFAAITERLDLYKDLDNQILSYSGGMRRRLIVSQSLLGDPQVICMDEPTAELDAESIARIHELVLERAKTAVVIMTTHLAKELMPHAVQNLRVSDGGTAQV